VLPWLERCRWMDGRTLEDARPSAAINDQLNVKIASHEPVIHAAVERLLESNLRGVLATLTPEQVNADTEAFARALMEEAVDDFSQLGLELDSLQITALLDGVGYLNALGRWFRSADHRSTDQPLGESG